VRLAALALAVASVLGGAAGAPQAPRDTEPWWSPQGTTLAFERVSPSFDGTHTLFTAAVRGPEADIVGAGRPRGFRPGGGELLVEGESATAVRDAQDRQVGTIPGIDATWSPDGAHVAFLAGDSLAVSDPTGARVQTLASGVVPPPDDVGGPVWSPDGTAILVATGSTLEVVQADGSGTRVLYDQPGENVDPSWSPDGNTIAFERSSGGRWSVWLVGADGGDPREAFPGSANSRFPQWSPVDGRLAYLTDASGQYALDVRATDGSVQQLVAAVTPTSPARWSPDGRFLAVSSAVDCGRFGIYVVHASLPAQPVRRSNQCRIEGTAGPDLIYGTPYGERIDGLAGNDRLFGNGGNDVIDGGPGNDGIGGGAGNDVIDGGPGNDVLSGGAGNDVIDGGPGRDKIGCGPGNDTVILGPGDTERDCEHVRRHR
jgi:Tol biopolymer transport system component